MRAFNVKLEWALTQGAVLAALSLAGCSGEGASGGSSVPPDGGVFVSALKPLPEGETACTGESYNTGDFGYHGQCCGTVKCNVPENGVCASGENAPLGSYGSGECLCGATAGPFAATSTESAAAPGSCCYVVHSIGCDGRPLLVAGDAVLSEITLRSDWIASDLLELLAV